jgi:hypothetical protein
MAVPPRLNRLSPSSAAPGPLDETTIAVGAVTSVLAAAATEAQNIEISDAAAILEATLFTRDLPSGGYSVQNVRLDARKSKPSIAGHGRKSPIRPEGAAA